MAWGLVLVLLGMVAWAAQSNGAEKGPCSRPYLHRRYVYMETWPDKERWEYRNMNMVRRASFWRQVGAKLGCPFRAPPRAPWEL